jgi:hypothetical protein
VRRVACTPRFIKVVEEVVKGGKQDEETAALAGQSAVHGARPVNYNQFKCSRFIAIDLIKVEYEPIAAMDLGGKPDDYDIGEEKVFLKSDPSKSLSYAQAAQRAIELGGAFSGKEASEDLNPITQASVAALAGSGLIGVAKDKLDIRGQPPAFAVGFMTIELDVESGKWQILDYLGVADCGTVIHPMGLANQVRGGAVMWGSAWLRPSAMCSISSLGFQPMSDS